MPVDTDAIRQRLDAATPGPWAWRGYTDGSIELRTVGRGGQRLITTARGEPCVVELLDGSIALTFEACESCKAEGAKTKDPWLDYQCPKQENLDTIWLRDHDAGFIRPANHWAAQEVTYRKDVASVEHPDAQLIANAPTDLAALLEENERLRAALTAAAPTVRAVGDRTVQRLCHEAMPELFPSRAGRARGGKSRF